MRTKGPQSSKDYDEPDNDGIPHATAGGYTNHGCRGPRCRAAFGTAIFNAAQRRKRKGLPPGDKRHGTLNGYGNYGCRCTLCQAAKAEDRKAQKAA